MSYIVNLRKTQKGLVPVFHPLFLAEVPEEDLAVLVENFLRDKSERNRELVILKSLPLLRYTVGRFLLNWPITRILVDDIVGEGALSICKTVDRLEEKHLNYLAGYILSNIRKAIERHINDIKSLAAPRLRENYIKRKKNGKPIYFNQVTNNTSNVASFNFDFELFEAFEVLEKLALTQDEKLYLEAILQGETNIEKGKNQLQKRFEKFLRSLAND